MKHKIELISGILLTIVSILILILPIFNITDVKLVLEITFISYTIINLLRYILTYKTKDYEGLHTFLLSLFLAIFLIFSNFKNSSLSLALIIFTFMAIMSFIRLKKADYYNDRKNKMWIIEITTLIMFIIIGILTSTSIILTSDGNIFMIGFLFFINGFIEIIDPIINYIK